MAEVATPIAEAVKAHPAKFSDAVLAVLVRFIPDGAAVLDPFAGVGRVHELGGDRGICTFGVEIEPEWAANHPFTMVGNALDLPSAWTAKFDVVCTSPTFGNRMADAHEAKDTSRRHTYRHVLGRKLHPANSGQLPWSEKYREFHRLAWTEVRRVLKADGLFLLNISNHIRKGIEQPVMAWHLKTCLEMGFSLVALEPVKTPRMRHGENHEARMAHEYVLVLRRRP